MPEEPSRSPESDRKPPTKREVKRPRCSRCGKLLEPDDASAIPWDEAFCFWCGYVEPQG